MYKQRKEKERTKENEYILVNEMKAERKQIESVVKVDLYIEGVLVTTLISDGVVVTTGGGSTAGCYTNGAPLVYPYIPTIVIAPKCPHSLSF